MPLLQTAALLSLLGTTPTPPPSPSAATRPAVMIKAVPTTKKMIAFTFDDGPNRRYTPKVLALLQKYHAKATFFVIGREVVRFPDMIQTVRAAGMEIGNHGMNHKLLQHLSESGIEEDVTGGAQAIIAAGAPKPYLYRLPAALSDDLSRRTLGKLGYTIVSWSVDTRDWRRGISAERIVQTVMRDAAPGRIVIMHDGPARRGATLKALEQVLPQLQAQGYRIVSVGELLQSSDFAAHRKLVPNVQRADARKPTPAPAPRNPKGWRIPWRIA